MNKEQLIAHINAHSATYVRDAAYFTSRGDHYSASFARGKSEAFATVASWLEVSGV